ncbi:hypothetical protein AAHA92_30543 [Salvia divinorum]|uniref:Zinc finger PHD-type domain-containing protein n=1 Tax=Salvia divinorum TaxID=28513 RepID=A0ABD1FR72_SALDI
MEHESFSHMFHEHPLSWIPDSAKESGQSYNFWCYGCQRLFLPGDATYGCSLKCGFPKMLHKECMEMPREIMHPLHPSHPLTLQVLEQNSDCAVCEVRVFWLCYGCSQGGCDGLWIHLGCADDVCNDKNEKQAVMKHPSHPQHELCFSKKTRWCPFLCNACGVTGKGDSYICTLCDYWIHETCALLPLSVNFPHHHHALSLAFSPPREYIQYEFDCGICSTTLPLRRWVYHCNLCRYVVHLNCATSTFDDGNAVDDDKEGTKFPIAVDDMYEEIIRPFVKRQRGQILDDHNIIGDKYSSSNHPHLLTFTAYSSSSSSSSSHHHCKKDDDDDEDDFGSIPRSELICDGCTLAIHQKKQTADDDEYDETGYISCDECKYFLHLSCFNLPLHIPSLPIHPLEDHSLTLRNAAKLTDWIWCIICHSFTSGLYYKCTICHFEIDIKCASLPNTVKHTAHPRHNYLKLVTSDMQPEFCVNCYEFFTSTEKGHYKCNSCRFCVCGACVMLPASNKHRLENHLLPLTYDARVNRPGEFYCSSCENPVDPRSWMYHCRDCDQSFHPRCFPATAAKYKNIKYGAKQYVISSIHDPRHPLRFQIITNKKKCDLCHQDAYNEPGFQCASCFFAVCLLCGRRVLGDA